MSRPDLSRVPEWGHHYINQVKESDLGEALLNQRVEFIRFLEMIPGDKRDYRYAPKKWTIKEMVQHILDAERVFAYRALSFARKDLTPLPGFDEDRWADHSRGSSRNWKDLVEEFSTLRRSTELLFASFDDGQRDAAGTASGKQIYVLAIGFIIAGHIEHHVNVIKERYL